MAVARVYGTVDGVEVVLNQETGDRWSVPVPFDTDGEYVVEIIAEDDAGNQAYLAKMLFAVNTALLCVHMIPLPYYASLMDHGLYAKVLTDNLCMESLPPEYGATVAGQNYYADLIMPDCHQIGGK